VRGMRRGGARVVSGVEVALVGCWNSRGLRVCTWRERVMGMAGGWPILEVKGGMREDRPCEGFKTAGCGAVDTPLGVCVLRPKAVVVRSSVDVGQYGHLNSLYPWEAACDLGPRSFAAAGSAQNCG
jgi:hypothetical protein